MTVSIGSSCAAHAERGGERARVGLGRARRSKGEGMIVDADALGAERVGCEAGDERRVDPAGEPEHDVLRSRSSRRSRAARAQRAHRSRPRPARAARPRAGSSASGASRLLAARRLAAERGQRRQHRAPRARRGAPRGRWLGSRSRAAAAASRSTSHTSSSSRNCAARAIVAPVWSITHECPSKTSSSWPPTSAQKATHARLSRARCANIRSRSAPLPAW